MKFITPPFSKKAVNILIISLLCSMSANAQFNIGGLKNKMKQKVESKVKDKTDEAKEKLNQAKYDAEKAAMRKNNSSNEGAGTTIVEEDAQASAVQQPTSSQAVAAPATPAPPTKEFTEAMDKAEAAIGRLKAAIEQKNEKYIWEDPEGMDYKRYLNQIRAAEGFDGGNARFLDLLDKFNEVNQAKSLDNSDRPAVANDVMFSSTPAPKRLQGLWTILDHYLKKAQACKYTRQKEYYIAYARMFWEAVNRDGLLKPSDAKAKSYATKMNAYAKANLNKAKSAKCGWAGTYAETIDEYSYTYGAWFTIKGDATAPKEEPVYYDEDIPTSFDWKTAMKLQLKGSTVTNPESGNVYTFDSFNYLSNKYGTVVAYTKDDFGDKTVFLGDVKHTNYKAGTYSYISNTKTWEVYKAGDLIGKIKADGSVYIMHKKVATVNLSQVDPVRVIIAYIFAARDLK